MKQAIIYCRSTNLNDKDIKSQKDSLKRFAKKHDIKIIKVFIDNGYNGCSYDRPSFKDAIKHLKDNRNDILLIYRFNTLSESQIDLQSILETFRVKNVRIMTFKEKFSMNI